jgi:hypothetical protein|nr:MAG TPA: hypothetical protein [Caudoviricetes sp.]
MFAVAYYALFFIAALIPTSIYCHHKESENNNED